MSTLLVHGVWLWGELLGRAGSDDAAQAATAGAYAAEHLPALVAQMAAGYERVLVVGEAETIAPWRRDLHRDHTERHVPWAGPAWKPFRGAVAALQGVEALEPPCFAPGAHVPLEEGAVLDLGGRPGSGRDACAALVRAWRASADQAQEGGDDGVQDEDRRGRGGHSGRQCDAAPHEPAAGHGGASGGVGVRPADRPLPERARPLTLASGRTSLSALVGPGVAILRDLRATARGWEWSIEDEAAVRRRLGYDPALVPHVLALTAWGRWHRDQRGAKQASIGEETAVALVRRHGDAVRLCEAAAEGRAEVTVRGREKVLACLAAGWTTGGIRRAMAVEGVRDDLDVSAWMAREERGDVDQTQQAGVREAHRGRSDVASDDARDAGARAHRGRAPELHGPSLPGGARDGGAPAEDGGERGRGLRVARSPAALLLACAQYLDGSSPLREDERRIDELTRLACTPLAPGSAEGIARRLLDEGRYEELPRELRVEMCAATLIAGGSDEDAAWLLAEMLPQEGQDHGQVPEPARAGAREVAGTGETRAGGGPGPLPHGADEGAPEGVGAVPLPREPAGRLLVVREPTRSPAEQGPMGGARPAPLTDEGPGADASSPSRGSAPLACPTPTTPAPVVNGSVEWVICAACARGACDRCAGRVLAPDAAYWMSCAHRCYLDGPPVATSSPRTGAPTMSQMPETREPTYLDEEQRQLPAPLALRPDAPLAPRAETPPEARRGPSMSTNVDDFFAALIDAKLEFPLITKSRIARVTKGTASYTYRYANLADVMEQIGPIMQRHGLAHVTIPMGNRVYVRIVHRASRQWIEGVLPLALPDHGSDVQRMGSALTYTERYLLCRLLGIVAAEDEDDDGAAQTQAARR